MKTIPNISSDQRAALKFTLEEISPNDSRISITIRDLRQIDKICKLIEAEGVSIELEDVDFEYLKKKFDSYQSWNPKARQIVIEVADKLEQVRNQSST